MVRKGFANDFNEKSDQISAWNDVEYSRAEQTASLVFGKTTPIGEGIKPVLLLQLTYQSRQ
jgi:hypothetical protein